MMYLITYDLNQGILHNYEPLMEEIRGLGVWWKYMDRTWIVATNLSVEEVSNRLTRHLGQPDRMIITRLTMPYQGWLPQEAYDWINQMYPQWGSSGGWNMPQGWQPI